VSTGPCATPDAAAAAWNECNSIVRVRATERQLTDWIIGREPAFILLNVVGYTIAATSD